MNYVYVIVEEGSWDYEPTNDVIVFETFEKALKEFQKRVDEAKKDMAEWIDNAVCEQTINKEEEYASFETYEDGDFTRLHDTIVINKEKIN